MSSHVIQTAPGAGGGGSTSPGGADTQIQYNDAGAFGAEAGLSYNKTDNQLTVPGQTLTEDLLLTGVISPSTISADQNDYAPTGFATCSSMRLVTDASRTLTGLAGGAAGRIVLLLNVGSENLVLSNQNASSSAANRFDLNQTTITIPKDCGCFLMYDGVDSRWRTVIFNGFPAGSDTYVQYNSAGIFGAESVFTYNASTNTLSVPNASFSGTVDVTTTLNVIGNTVLGTDNTKFVFFSAGKLILATVLSPAQFTANQDNFTPASDALVYRLSSDASRNLTGWVAGTGDSPIFVVVNVGSQNIVLKDESASSTAENRFALNGDLTLAPDMAVWFMYDEVSARWRVISQATAGSSTNALLDGVNHTDTLAGTVVDGDTIIGNATPKWSRLAITVPAANVLNVLGVANGETRPSWKSLFDATNPADLGAAAPGTSLIAAHRDHVHLDPVTAHVAAGDPHTGYRLESADHSHASSGAQGGTVSHDVLTDVSANDHHNQAHALDGADHTLSGATDGHVLKATGATTFGLEEDNATITFVIDGGGAAITTGIKGDLEIPFGCVIQRATLLADQSGSIVIDIWKDTYANYPPTDADSITASAPPTISSATKSQDSTLTGWTTTITAGDILRFNVDSITTVQRVTLSLKVRKT